MTERVEACERCRFWVSTGASGYEGRCRRRAPMPNFSGDEGNMSTVWPDSYAEDWCGEFEPQNGALNAVRRADGLSEQP